MILGRIRMSFGLPRLRHFVYCFIDEREFYDVAFFMRKLKTYLCLNIYNEKEIL